MRKASIAETKALQFIKAEPGFGRKMGETITISRARNITVPGSAILPRNGKIPVDQMPLAQTQITLQKFGRAVEFDEDTVVLSYFDPNDFIQGALMKQMKLSLDGTAFGSFKGCQIRYAPQSAVGGTFTTDAGSTPATATFNVGVSHLKIIRDYLAATIHCEPYEGDDWIGLAATKALRGVKDDPEFMAWRQYIQPEMAFYRGEAGMVEHIRLVEIVYGSGLAGNKGTGSVLGEMVIFGNDPVVMIEAVTPELRRAIPGNYGLQHSIAWYGMLNFGEVWDTANDVEARIIYVTSS
jgi:N4-gp56 family major capsid protein